MKILTVFDKGFPIDKPRLKTFFKINLSYLSIDIQDELIELEDSILSKPSSFTKLIGNTAVKQYDKVFYFTVKPYNDNYFYHTHNDISIFSCYGWDFLTNLPYSNGVIYFITNFLILNLDNTSFRHDNITGCIYDFLREKRGIDDGMRQARLCTNCLERLETSLTEENEKIFIDLKRLMDVLSTSSRWNIDILLSTKTTSKKLSPRNPKSKQGINVAIISPGDTTIERELLLNNLERRFRAGNYETRTGYRIMVNGWEDLASQNGYGQDVINDSIIAEADFLVAVFMHRLGTPTKDVSTGVIRAESGTAEELLQALDNQNETHPIGMAYFHSKAPVISLDSPDKKRIEDEWNRLKQFKESIKDKMIFKPYTDPLALLNLVAEDLEKNISQFIKKIDTSILQS